MTEPQGLAKNNSVTPLPYRKGGIPWRIIALYVVEVILVFSAIVALLRADYGRALLNIVVVYLLRSGHIKI